MTEETQDTQTHDTESDNLPYDKVAFGKLIGYAEQGDEIIVNSVIMRPIKCFNVYVQVNNFYKMRESQGNDATPLVFEFSSWLFNNGFIGDTISEIIDRNVLVDHINNVPSYSVVPYHPSYSDILWTARILQDATSFYTPENIFHLALYRGMVIDGLDVENIVKARVHDDILSLAIHLKDSHDKRVSDLYSNIKA